jgi:hypothetical protein
MHVVEHTDENGNVRKLLLTDAEYEASLHRAQENAGDLSPQRLREVTGEPNHNEPKRDQLNG